MQSLLSVRERLEGNLVYSKRAELGHAGSVNCATAASLLHVAKTM